MLTVGLLFVDMLRGWFKSRRRLQAEILILRWRTHGEILKDRADLMRKRAAEFNIALPVHSIDLVNG